MTIRLLLISAFCLIPAVARAQGGPAPEGYIIFKDGFTIHGRIMQQKQYEIDPGTGSAYVIPTPGGFTLLDDEVRRVYFPPGQIAPDGIIKRKPGELNKDQILFEWTKFQHSKSFNLPQWRFKELPPFNKFWERIISVESSAGPFTLRQRIVQLTPQRMRIQSSEYNWEMNFLTSERPFSEVTKLVTDYLDTKKEYAKLSKEDKDYIRARFYQQMGQFDEADKLAKDLLEQVPEQKKKIEEFIDVLDRDKAKKFGDDFEPLAAAKQHRTIREKLVVYDKQKLFDKVPDPVKLHVQDLKNKYEADNEKIEKAKAHFKFLMSKNPNSRGFWLTATTAILQELNYDTLPRLDTFINFAEQYQRDVGQDKEPTLKLENVLALAITGWHLGNIAAEPDIKLAEHLWKGRDFVRNYMKADTAGQRTLLSEAWVKETKLPIDVVARMLQHLPPPNAYAKLSSEIMMLDLDLPDAPPGTYLVKLPPDYHHERAHPVLVLIHGHEPADVLMARWTPLAAKHGFVLVAPLWTKFSKAWYSKSDAEHTYFMNCLKDLKRRFQVDTDRVFLFGWADGGEVAWDVGLGHPDQFAGVLPMCGVPNEFSKNYWQNAQNLGVYIVDGDKNGSGPIVARGLFKECIRLNFNAYFLEYKGRANELYLGEFEPMMDWMSRKKRQYPTRSLSYANVNNVSANAEAFRSFRQSDNRFYWLSSDEISDNNRQDAYNWVNGRTPAKFQGSIAVENGSSQKGDAVIKTNVSLNIQGLKQCTVWLTPNMIDFTKPVQMRINGKTSGNLRKVEPSIPTMLEEYFLNVDRQRLYYARIDLKL